MTGPIYLDYAAPTPIDPRVVERIGPFHGAANASSAHAPGRYASDAVEEARAAIASLVGASGEVVFTSGATEADNLAIGGALLAAGEGHFVTTAAEHKAVLETTKAWCPETTLVPVGSDGAVDAARIEAAIRPDTVLVSVMAANNEVGTLSPLEEIGEVCRARGVLFHSDAAQAVGKIPINVRSAHPPPLHLRSQDVRTQGHRCALVRRGAHDRVRPLLHGGGHERGFRPGTVNVAACVGFGEAARIATAEAERDHAHRAAVTAPPPESRRSFSGGGGPRCGALPSGHRERPRRRRRCGVAAAGHTSPCRVHRAACTSAVPAPSQVLLAMGLGHSAALESMRLTFGRFTTTGEIYDAVEALKASAEVVRDTAAEVPA